MKRILLLLSLLSLSAICQAGGEYIDYRVDGNPYRGYFISPDRNAPLILLVHDWDGLTDYEVKRAQMLADDGYAVFALDLFGKGNLPTTLEGKKQLTSALYADRKLMLRLLQGALKKARELQPQARKQVATGYCFGGAAVLELARSGEPMDGFVTFHGGLATPSGEDYSATRGRLLILHGSADTSVPISDFAALAGELERYHVPNEMILYSGAPHAFTVFGSERYREDADHKSWRRYLEFLKELNEE